MSHLLRSASFGSAGDLLFLNEELSDLTIVVLTDGSYWHFPVHSLILSAQSSVFRMMLENDSTMEEKKIILDDISPSTIQHLLQYIYCGKLSLENWSDGIDLLQAASKYKIDNLVQKCGRFLEEVLSLSNVCYIYDKASSCSLPVLQDRCLKLILDAGFLVLRSKAFELLNKDCAIDIIASSNLNVESELIVFETLLRWAQIECCRTGQAITEANILAELKPFLQHVCIDDMSDADKSAIPPILLSYVKPNNRNRIGFSVQNSLLSHSKNLEFEVNKNCLDFIGDNLSCIRFSTDASVYLIGLRFVLVASRIPSQLPLIMVKENAPKLTLFNMSLSKAPWIESMHVNQRTWHESQILLQHPVNLKAGDIYNLYVEDIGNDIQCPQMTVITNSLRTSSGNVHFSIHGEEIWGIANLILI